MLPQNTRSFTLIRVVISGNAKCCFDRRLWRNKEARFVCFRQRTILWYNEPLLVSLGCKALAKVLFCCIFYQTSSPQDNRCSKSSLIWPCAERIRPTVLARRFVRCQHVFVAFRRIVKTLMIDSHKRFEFASLNLHLNWAILQCEPKKTQFKCSR